MLTIPPPPHRPPAWTVLEDALTARRSVHLRYHRHRRVICPHALGWTAGRHKVLAYQTGGTTSTGPLPADPTQRWRWMFVDEIEDPAIIDQPWETAANHIHHPNCIDHLELAVPASTPLLPALTYGYWA